MMRNILLIIFSFFFLISCENDDIDKGYVIEKNEKYELVYPNNFPELTFDTIKYPITKNGVKLGKMLFYEGKLSRDNTISCGSCHIQEFAFTHHGHNVSHGIEGKLGIRNAPAIQNLAFAKNFMWDGVIHDLTRQSLAPISDANEMDSTIEEIVSKLKKEEKYKSSFRAAFGSDEINGEKILIALGQFMAVMISSNSKFDQFLSGKISLTENEQKGYKIFQQKCSTCHSGTLQTDESFRNTGHYYNSQYADGGRFRVTLDSIDFMKFKVPSLRNIELTAPYMHDGRFYSLEAVLNFYSDGVQNNKNLDPLLKQNGIIGISISNQEKNYLLDFLKTLTDQDFITNKNFAEF